ncbi:hypothetical protein JTE90_019955 [Oedothorax gibbosus]|uniref:nicotinamidase n=1 Tax=Oedothorax gibbosus TaxID=931172 RepID=A0AAV6UTE1_9ARAC|nr:hypothetical protein JTE90_019955 [Oedothorax gibbosus]
MRLPRHMAEQDFSKETTFTECFRLFDEDDKQYLNKDDLGKLVKCVIKHDTLPDEFTIDELFACFDKNSDGKIDEEEFNIVWNDWIIPLTQPVTALIIVDVQNDFIDGSLAMKNCPAKQDGNEIVPIINNLLESVNFDIVVYSIDCHPEDHISFFENVNIRKLSDTNEQSLEDIKLYDTVTFEGPPEVTQKLWPIHCVKDTFGCQLHPDLKVVENSIFVNKGQNPTIDSYSAFWDNNKISQTELHSELQRRKVTHVFVCGLALDYCVAYTALDAVEFGYATVLVEDAARGTDIDNIEAMKNKLVSNLCVVASSTEAINLANGDDIQLEFAKVLALQ